MGMMYNFLMLLNIELNLNNKEKKTSMRKQDKETNFNNVQYNTNIKKGNVFWFNINTTVDRFNTPIIITEGIIYHDSIDYGYHPWLVVSDDSVNEKGINITIVPIHEAPEVDRDLTHVNITYEGRDCVVLCDQPMSVAAGRLDPTEQKTDVSLEDLLRVDKALAQHFGISSSTNHLNNANMGMLADMVNSIIEVEVQKEFSRFKDLIANVSNSTVTTRGRKKTQSTRGASEKVSKATKGLTKKSTEKIERVEGKNFGSRINIPDEVKQAILTESENLESKTNTEPTPEEPKKKRKYTKKADIKKTSETKKQIKGKEENSKKTTKKKAPKSGDDRKPRTEWDEETSLEFLVDCENMTMKEVATKWGYTDISGAYHMRTALKKKFDL